MIALELSRYCRATRFTSTGVTFLMASMSSSGECRPSPASASEPNISYSGDRVAFKYSADANSPCFAGLNQVFRQALLARIERGCFASLRIARAGIRSS